MTNPNATMLTPRNLAILTAICGAAALRLVPHAPNFTPIGAMALFGGAFLASRRVAVALPLAALFVSDLVIGFHSTMLAVYAAFALIVLLGASWLRRPAAHRVLGASLAASTLFFLVTNFAVWLGGGYPMTAAGLGACYVAAIPFFGNTVAGDLFYCALLFGGFALIERAVPMLRAPVRAAA